MYQVYILLVVHNYFFSDTARIFKAIKSMLKKKNKNTKDIMKEEKFWILWLISTSLLF